MKYKTTGSMAIDFERTVCYLKNYVFPTRTTHINLSAVDTDLLKILEAQSKYIALLNHKVRKRNGGKLKVTNVGASFPNVIKYKFYGGGDLSKCDRWSLSCQG